MVNSNTRLNKISSIPFDFYVFIDLFKVFLFIHCSLLFRIVYGAT